MSESWSQEQNQIIAENIRKHRLQKGLKQEDIADGLCSVSQFSKLENGKSPFKPLLLKQIANRLGVTEEQLLEADDRQEELREMIEMSRNALMTNHVALSLDYARRAAQNSKEYGHSELYVQAILAECQGLVRIFRFEEIIERVERVLYQERMPLTTFDQISLHLELGRAQARVGNMETAFAHYVQAETMFQEVEDLDPQNFNRMRIGYILAIANYEMRHYLTALHYIREAKRLAVLNDRRVWELYTINIEANILVEMGEHVQAEQLYLQALEGMQKVTLIAHVTTVQHNIGYLYLKNQEYGEAHAYFQKAMKNYEMIENRYGQCESLLDLAEVALLEQNTVRALEFIGQVVSIHAEEPIGYMYLARMHRVLSRLHLSQGDFERGSAELIEALQIYDEHSVFFEAYEVAVYLAELLYARGDARTVDYYRQAINYDKRLGPLR